MPVKTPPESEKYEIEALRKGLAVLATLSAAPRRGFTISEISDLTELPLDFCMRALRTLEADDFAREKQGGWRLGQTALALADRFGKEQQ